MQKKLDIQKWKRKGSFTIEAAIIVPLFLMVYAAAIQTGLNIYSEIKSTREESSLEDLWLVDDFYRYQPIREVIGN